MRHFVKILAVCALLAGCTPFVATRGNILEPEKLTAIEAGKASREDVIENLGTPTVVSSFDDKNWYYIGRETEQFSFLDPKIKKAEVVRVAFNDTGIVKSVDRIDPNLVQDIAPAPGKTPTQGKDDAFIKQFIGNLGRPAPNLGQPQR